MVRGALRNLLAVALAALGAFAAPGSALAGPPLLPCREVEVLSAPAGAPLDQPTDVVVDARGRRYVLDGVNGRVVTFDAGGRYQGSFGGAGQMSKAVGLGIDRKRELVYVADTAHGQILVYGTDGTQRSTWALPRDAKARPGPTDVIAVGRQAGGPPNPAAAGERLVVVDNDNHLLRVLDRTGKQLSTFGAFGENVGQVRFPATIAEGPDGGLYVVDVLGSRVVRWNADGTQPRQISQFGTEPGTLFRPKGIAVDAGGRVYVSDSLYGIVQVFGPNDALLGVLGAGVWPLRLEAPTSLAFDERGRLHVVETRANRVRVLEVRVP